MNDHSMADESALNPKAEASREGTPSSVGSSPDQEVGAEASHEPTQPQKRKGGRKPIYATSEERKQRNRQAQAAFRERRTEYIKQLEATIKQNEEMLNSLQENHRRINNDCLMLRYKNSLLERILLEKGIDVQSELEAKQNSPALSTGFINPASGLAQTPQSQLQRTALQRQQARMSGGRAFVPKMAAGQTAADMGFVTSPHNHPTPSSHASSPSQLSTQSPMAMQNQAGMASPGSHILPQSQQQQFQNFARVPQQQAMGQTFMQPQMQQAQNLRKPVQRPTAMHSYHNSAGGMSNHSSSTQHSVGQPGVGNMIGPKSVAAPSASSFYPSPFQKHFDQLDQEYDAQNSRSMLDGPEADEDDTVQQSADMNGAYAQHFDPQQTTDFYNGTPNGAQQLTPQPQYDQTQGMPPTSHPAVANGHFNMDPSDPLIDQDPFGLSASMHYPTSYSFDQQQSAR